MAGVVACVIFSRLHFASQAPMTTLLLSPTRKHFRIGDKGDYCVLDGGRVIGRIFRQPQAPEDRPWLWTITASDIPPSSTSGATQLRANKRWRISRRVDGETAPVISLAADPNPAHLR